MSVGRRSRRGIIPSLAEDCIAIFVKQFLQSGFGGCCLAAENNSLLWPVNGRREFFFRLPDGLAI
jgi:hypothetical protein